MAMDQKKKPPKNKDFVAMALQEAEKTELSMVEQAMGQDVTSGSAGTFANIKAGVAENPSTKIDIYAKSLFPDMPIEEARKRFSSNNGEILYVDKEGKLKDPSKGVPEL
jgi:hypothetical protein